MIGFRRVGVQLCRGQHDAEEEPGAMGPGDEIGVLALPAEAGLFRQRLFHQGRGVDKDFHLLAGLARKFLGELFQPALHHVMIIAVAGIDGNIAGGAGFQVFERIALRPVIHGDDEGGFRLRPHIGGLFPALERCFHPAHGAVTAFFDKFLQPSRRRPGLIGAADADSVKAERGGGLLERGSRSRDHHNALAAARRASGH